MSSTLTLFLALASDVRRSQVSEIEEDQVVLMLMLLLFDQAFTGTELSSHVYLW